MKLAKFVEAEKLKSILEQPVERKHVARVEVPQLDEASISPVGVPASMDDVYAFYLGQLKKANDPCYHKIMTLG